MRRVLLVALLPVVWVPLVAFLVTVAPAVPWYAWVFALVFWVLLWRRRHSNRLDAAPGAEGAPLWSPTGRGGY